MTLPADNAAKYAIGLGGYGFPVQAYAKRGQENPVSRVQVGSDDFLATDRASFWTQEDYSGGNYQYEWHDQAMISTSEGVFPNQLSHAVRTMPRLILGKSSTAMGITARVTPATGPIEMFSVDNTLLICFPGRIVRVVLSATGGVASSNVDSHAVTKTCFAYDNELSRLLAGGSDNNIYVFNRSTLALAATIAGVNEAGAAITGPITMIDWFGDMLVVGFGAYLYVQTDTGKFRKINNGSARPTAGRLSGTPVDSCAFNGQLYVLLRRLDSYEGRIVSTNGTAVMSVAEIPYSVQPQCMREYAGRLYIGCRGSDLDDQQDFGELYELTGTSLRLVRSFQRERLTQGPVTGPLRTLDVFDGFLVMPNESRQGIEVYDASNDAFFTGPCLDLNSDLSRPDISRLMRYAIGCRDQLFMWAIHATDGTKSGLYRTKVSTDPATTHKGQGCFVTSSDFDPEPMRLKVWQKVTFKTRNFGVVYVRVSTNGGASWSDLTGPTVSTDGDVIYSTFALNTIAPARRIRLQWWVLPSSATTYGEYLAHTVAFMFQEHDKHGWQITIPCTYRTELLDDSLTPDAEAPFEKIAQLWNWSDLGTVVTLRDRDGTSHKVILTQVVESEAHVGHTASTREAYLSMFLLEV